MKYRSTWGFLNTKMKKEIYTILLLTHISAPILLQKKFADLPVEHCFIISHIFKLSK